MPQAVGGSTLTALPEGVASPGHHARAAALGGSGTEAGSEVIAAVEEAGKAAEALEAAERNAAIAAERAERLSLQLLALTSDAEADVADADRRLS